MSTPRISEKEAFARFIKALEPYLPHLVIAGGWAHRLLMETHPKQPAFTPLMTRDLDLATLPERFQGIQDMAARLATAGITEALRGDVRPPLTRYVMGNEAEGGLYAEFLIPRIGSGIRRDGQPDITGTVGGATAQKLAYIDLLVVAPWSMSLGEAQGYPLGSPGLQVQIANPLSYLAQKILVLDKRSSLEKKGKDILYLHDTLLLFASEQARVKEALPALLANMHASWQQELTQLVANRFKNVDDAIRQASRIAQETGRPSPPGPDVIAKVCSRGLRTLFTPDTPSAPPGAK